MAIVFHCASCNHTLRVPEDVAGKRIKCPQCHEVLRIPETSEETSPDRTKSSQDIEDNSHRCSFYLQNAARRDKFE